MNPCQMEATSASRCILRRLAREETGNVSVFVALSMMTIVFFAALAIDLGILTMEKDDLQNKVEAAVESGVRVLHNPPNPQPGFIQAVMECAGSLNKNGEMVSPPMLLYGGFFQYGFYDHKGVYGDFPTYKDFALFSEMPPGESANAVALLNLKKNIETIEIKQSGQTKGRVGASAVAYGVNYTFLALSDASDALLVDNAWQLGFPRFTKCTFGSNNDIQLNANATYDNSSAEAVGTITNPPPVSSECSEIRAPAIDWEKLRQDALNNGVVYDCSEWTEDLQTDAYGNKYCRRHVWAPAKPPDMWNPDGKPRKDRLRYFFQPHTEVLDNTDTYLFGDADHDGRTYFFEMEDPSEQAMFDGPEDMVILYILPEQHALPAGTQRNRFRNCTLAATGMMSTFPGSGGGGGFTNGNNAWPSGLYTTYFGDYENYPDATGLVYLFCKDMGYTVNYFDKAELYAAQGSTFHSKPTGLAIRSEEAFKLRNSFSPALNTTYYLKVLANSIELKGGNSSVEFVGGFGKPDIYKLGRLRKTP
jgi:hypothetical protein